MTREELKEHCLKQIEMCEFWAIGKGEKPSGKVYEEHKLILELLEQELTLDKLRTEIKTMGGDIETIADVLAIIDKYKLRGSY